MISAWTSEMVAAAARAPLPAIALIDADAARPVLPGLYLWDMWPVTEVDGTTARFDGAELWLVLAAPRAGDPGERHHQSRIRLLRCRDGAWTDLGNVMPDGFSPGSREWAGSAVVDAGHERVTLYFTAAGRRGEVAVTFEQRLFAASAALAGGPVLTGWAPPVEIVANDGVAYAPTHDSHGGAGQIKGFRDPAWFRDPADGADYMLFTGSSSPAAGAFDGVVGIARRDGAHWQLLPPIVTALGVNRELERPHVVLHSGRYYLFWSTQRSVFACAAGSGPTGLYGMVAAALAGPYVPLNGSGLVAANPDAEPFQAYSWLVQSSLEVVSFVDHWGLRGAVLADHPELVESQFGGTPAPRFSIALGSDSATLCG